MPCALRPNLLPLNRPILQVLLGLLPPERDAWDSALARSRAEYARFVEELINEPLEEMRAADDHPLALDKGSTWHRYFADNELRDQISRDVDRTRRELHFFNAEASGRFPGVFPPCGAAGVASLAALSLAVLRRGVVSCRGTPVAGRDR